MTRFLRNNEDEVLEGDIYYWKITKLLPQCVKHIEKKFKLHNTSWIYYTSVDEAFFWACIDSICMDVAYLNRLFDIRIGIVGDNRQEIVSFNIRILSRRKLISISQLDSILLTNKFLYLFVEINRKSENGQKIKLRKQKMEADFKQLLLSGLSSDVIIEVKHKKFNCHRCILEARSPIFAAMLDHDMKEKDSGVLTIEDAEPDVFQEFLLYLYSGNNDVLSWKNIVELYKLADKYGMEDMKNVCTEDIKLNINRPQFFEFYKLSLLYNDSALTETVIQFFLKESDQIVQRKNWMRYLTENPAECNMLIIALSNKLQALQ